METRVQTILGDKDDKKWCGTDNGGQRRATYVWFFVFVYDN
jgi:hypothetical protein